MVTQLEILEVRKSMKEWAAAAKITTGENQLRCIDYWQEKADLYGDMLYKLAKEVQSGRLQIVEISRCLLADLEPRLKMLAGAA